MRIAFISIIRDPWGGSEELWAAAARQALKEGHDIYISAINRGVVSPQFNLLVTEGAKLYLRRGYIKPGTGLYKRVFKKALFFLLNKIINPYSALFRQNPDIIIYTCSCYSIKDDPGLITLLNKCKTPYIINTQVNIEYTKPINEADAEIIKSAYRKAAKVSFVSRRNLDVAQRHLLTDIKNSMIIRNPVNLNDISIIPFRRDGETAQFAMVANLLVNHKGHDVLLDLLRNKKWSERQWHLNIYGSGDDERYIKNLCTYFSLDKKVTFKGRTNDIRQVWTENDILLMPSLCEGIPLAVVEAMLCGRPVIATDVGGHMEWIEDGKSGFIAEAANVYSFDKAMERAWLRKNEWPSLGENAHKRALELYDPEPGVTLLKIILEHGRRS
jgi:L-malate glycosyltransferase